MLVIIFYPVLTSERLNNYMQKKIIFLNKVSTKEIENSEGPSPRGVGEFKDEKKRKC